MKVSNEIEHIIHLNMIFLELLFIFIFYVQKFPFFGSSITLILNYYIYLWQENYF
jgi:hypothetical protein